MRLYPFSDLALEVMSHLLVREVKSAWNHTEKIQTSAFSGRMSVTIQIHLGLGGEGWYQCGHHLKSNLPQYVFVMNDHSNPTKQRLSHSSSYRRKMEFRQGKQLGQDNTITGEPRPTFNTHMPKHLIIRAAISKLAHVSFVQTKHSSSHDQR